MTKDHGFVIPNLDGLSTEPADYLALAQTMLLVSWYLEGKAKAMALRLKGDVNAAVAAEDKIERIYKALPEWARW